MTGCTESQLQHIFLQQRQGQHTGIKISMTMRRIQHALNIWDDNCHVSFSGGADSTVLLHMARMVKPDIKAVFVDTGVEFPEIRKFVRTIENVVWLKPKKTFKQVCGEYGFPVVSKETAQKLHEVRTTKSDFMLQLRTTGVEGRKRQEIPKKWQFLIDAPFKVSHKCCHVLKKEPLFRYERETGSRAITGAMATESSARTQKLSKGCFIFGEHPTCNPMSFWTTQDVRSYLGLIPHCELYDPPFNFPRTGCMFCMFGAHLNKPNKFQLLKESHPRIHRLALPAFGIDKILDYMGVPYA